jgi:uncharacterized membrane protein
MILGGFGAPMFLFLAGVALPLAAGAKYRQTADRRAVSNALVARGLEVFGLAFLFRVQAWILGWSSPRKLLRVDILNIMGPSLMAAAALWGMARTVRGRFIAFAAATLASALLTPTIRTTRWLDVLPDPVEAYFRQAGGLTSFSFFPWAGFVFAGALVGLVIDQTAPDQQEARLNRLFIAGGLSLAALSYAGSFLPSIYERSEFWTSSPAFFFLRTGILVATLGLSYLWMIRGTTGWSPIQQLGRTSLFIYWIHVEMVYGLISLKLHKAMTLPQAWAAYAVFGVFMLACSVLKDRVVRRFRHRRADHSSPAFAR